MGVVLGGKPLRMYIYRVDSICPVFIVSKMKKPYAYWVDF